MLDLSEKHLALQQEVRAFLRAHAHLAPPAGGGRKRPDAQTRAWQKLLVEHGYAARTVPKEYGGYGAEPDVLDAVVIAQEFASANVHPGIMNQGISMLVPTLLEVGSPQQKRDWVGPTMRGEIIWCQGYSEPGAGSDLAAVSTRGEVQGDHFVVNGQKIWTSSAHYADMMFLLCRTEFDKPKHQGMSYLLLSMQSPGIEVRRLRTMTGSEFNEVFFTDVKVPVDQIVMGRGDGWKVANITLQHERVAVGNVNKLAHRVLRLTELLRATKVDGCSLLEHPEYLSRLTRLQGEVMAWKAHQMRLLQEQVQGVDSGVRRMIVKYGGTMTAHRLSALAVDALGAAGTVFEPLGDDGQDDEVTIWNTDHLYDIGLLLGGGTSNIQKNIIAERGLGMPREPRFLATASGSGG